MLQRVRRGKALFWSKELGGRKEDQRGFKDNTVFEISLEGYTGRNATFFNIRGG